MKKLDRGLDSIGQILQSRDDFAGAYVDQKQSVIVVQVLAGDHSGLTDQLSEAAKVPVEIQIVPSKPQKSAVRGGQMLRTSSTIAHRDCTSGFTAYSGSGIGVLTAGHCADTYFVADGSSRFQVNTIGSQFDDSIGVDAQLMSGSPGFTGQFYYNSTSNVRSVAGLARKANISSGDITSQSGPTVRPGSFICHLGQDFSLSTYSVQSCGEVVSKTYAYGGNYSTGRFLLIRSNKNNTRGTVGERYNGSLKCLAGDSGGPVFAYTTAYGIVSGCQSWDQFSTNPNERAHSMIVTSIDELENAGFTIVTQN